MEDDDIQTPLPASKYSRVSSNGRMGSSRVGSGPEAQPDSKSEAQRVIPTIATANGGDMVMGANRLRQWPHSSRIIRVSRASGGKDRHSKVWTAKGPRDRRVRLSVSTAIQFYDLQDRLGYDQPSKAVEWLIKAASEAINELPSLNSSNFPPETPRQPSDEPRAGNVLDSGDAELDGDAGLGQNQMGSMSKSGCSSNNSETSKGSGLSLSRSEIRVKARERARERTAKEKEKETDQQHQHRQQQPSSRINVNVCQQQHQNVNSIAPTSSFTQLLTAGINNLKYESNAAGANSSPSSRGANQWLSSTATTPMDYFGGLINPNSSRGNQPASGYHVGGVSLAQVMTISSFNNENHNGQHHNSSHNQQHELHQQHFPFVTDQHLLQVANTGGASGSGAGGGSDYNLSFSISSTSASSGGHNLGAGFNNNRGPLQSNSPPFLLPYLQSGSSAPFFLGGTAVENHQQQHFQPTGLQLYYGDTAGQSDQKGKGKN